MLINIGRLKHWFYKLIMKLFRERKLVPSLFFIFVSHKKKEIIKNTFSVNIYVFILDFLYMFRKIQLNKPTFSYSFLFHILLTTPTHTHLPPSPRLFFSWPQPCLLFTSPHLAHCFIAGRNFIRKMTAKQVLIISGFFKNTSLK